MIWTTLAKNPVGSYYHDRFFDAIDKSALASARVIVPIVRSLVNCDSVIDVGCGRGAWLNVFAECGSNRIIGLDGDYVDTSRLLIPSECFRAVDLARPIRIDEQFDLAVCLEVAEHLPRATSESLVAWLCNVAPAVLFSAAIPGQGGTNHINEQWSFIWTDIFRRHGFSRLDVIRSKIFNEPGVASWYKQNAFLYVADSLVANDPHLADERERTENCEVEIVAKYRLVPLMSVTGALGELGRAFRHAIRRRLGR